MVKVMDGQMNIFDQPREKKKPCEYGFTRYIGQKVRLHSGEVGTVVCIDSYYTTVKTDKGLLCGTPTTMGPVNREEYYERAFN